jgi:type I restriction enzyme S subunit
MVAETEWKQVAWGDLATLEYGKSLKGYRERTSGFRVYGTNGPIGWHDTAIYSQPSVIIGRKGAYRGVHYAPFPFFVIDTAFYVNRLRELDLKWGFFELLSFDINNLDSGSAIPSTSREDFYGVPVVVPPTNLQNAFGRIVESLFGKLYANEDESGSLAALRDTLLPKLLSGELRVGDAMKQVTDTMSVATGEPAEAEA